MKVAILICAHCRPEILKLTLGTWLEQYDGSYEAEIYVSLHKNYSDYCDDIQSITGMANIDVSFVKEVPWDSTNMLRYSEMHARCLKVLMEKALEGDCTHLIVLDHDLIFRSDFVGWCLREHGDSDLISGLLNDEGSVKPIQTDYGVMSFAPKLTAWHIFMSRRMVETILRTDSVDPRIIDGVVFDTLTLAYVFVDKWGFKKTILPCDELAKQVKHLWSLSFNFGVNAMANKYGVEAGIVAYQEKVGKYMELYKNRFTSGIDRLLKKLDRPV